MEMDTFYALESGEAARRAADFGALVQLLGQDQLRTYSLAWHRFYAHVWEIYLTLELRLTLELPYAIQPC